MARPVAIFLLVSLLIGGGVGLRLRNQTQRLREYRDDWIASIPDEDPRQKAAVLSRNVANAQQRVAGKLRSLAKLAPPPQITEKPDRPIAVAEETPDARRHRVEQLLAKVIDNQSLETLMRDLDPNLTPLPARVEVDPLALHGWAVLRARWSQPLGRKELDELQRRIGFTPPLLALLNPNNPLHVAIVRGRLQQHEVPIDRGLDWFARVPGGLQHQSAHKRGFTLPNYQGDAFQRFLRLRMAGQLIERFKPAWHTHGSAIVDPRMDELLVKLAASNQGDAHGLASVQQFATWRSVVHGAALRPVSDALWNNSILPNDRVTVNKRITESMGQSTNDAYAATFARYRLLLLGGATGRLGPRNDALLNLELSLPDTEPIDPKMQKVILALQVGCRIPEAGDDAKLNEIAASWNDSRHLSRLIRMAKSKYARGVYRAEPARVATVRLRQLNALALDEVAKFWMSQHGWTEQMTYAFGNDNIAGEHALLGAWLCGEATPKYEALRQTLLALSSSGGLATAVTLTLPESVSPIRSDLKTSYFLRHAAGAVRSIELRNRKFISVVDHEVLKP